MRQKKGYWTGYVLVMAWEGNLIIWIENEIEFRFEKCRLSKQIMKNENADQEKYSKYFLLYTKIS